MEYRLLGRSGFKVPLLSLGTGTFGGTTELFKGFGTSDVAEATRLVDVALDAGLTLFDSADTYSRGVAEEILGQAIKGRRDKVLISTKLTFRNGDGPNDVGSSRFHIVEGVNAALRRLGTDRIDLFQLHAFDALTPVEEALGALDDLVRAGKILYTGCSNFSGWHLMKSLAVSDRYGLVRYVAHHVAHAESACLAAPFPTSSVLVLDGRGETASHLAGRSHGGDLEVLATQQLPHSLGLLYEEVTEHLGFRRSSDEYKVMAMASYGEPVFLDELRRLVHATGDGGFCVEPIEWGTFVKRRTGDEDWAPEHADLASSVQVRLEEVVLDLARWLHARTGDSLLTMAGGVALNCVANSRLAAEGPFEELWVQPAAGDAGTALGGALHVAHGLGDAVAPMPGADLGREWSDDELEAWLTTAAVVYERPDDIAVATAEVLAANGVVAWFQGRSEYGPRALGHRSLLANPRYPDNLRRLNDVKGREQFRPVAPMVLAEAAADIFEGGPLPSPYMLFVHRVRPGWAERIPAVVHVDGTARAQTVDRHDEPLVHRLLDEVGRRTGAPVLINTSLNTAGRPMVDDPRDALECFGSAPVDALALGPFLIRRAASAHG
ncbi:MAG: aldo/keto reductase [Actinobacteria bacterium]|nr:aldo/keto reductase [Actinomycetota bacterium]